jgi:hypothetical protein
MKNRYGDEYHFRQVDEKIFTIEGSLKYWRYGGKEGQEKMDFNDLGFVDPSGGPFIEVGMRIQGREIVGIRVVNEQILFEVK